MNQPAVKTTDRHRSQACVRNKHDRCGGICNPPREACGEACECHCHGPTMEATDV